MRQYGIHFWRPIPFIRLLLPLAAGILVMHYTRIPPMAAAIFLICGISMLFITGFLPVAKKYRFRWVNGLGFNLCMFALGALLLHCRNSQHDPSVTGLLAYRNAPLLVTLQEPLTEKPNSYKALAHVEAAWVNSEWTMVNGSFIAYFKKDASLRDLQYGSQLLIQKPLQPIANSGNPGSFNYQQYCAFQGIHYQVYLQPDDYRLAGYLRKNQFTQWLLDTRDHVLAVLRKYIPGEKEIGVAEALLIGYRADLDRDLVKSYSQTGVVHIIAISGLHLGMIYGLMILLLKPLRRMKAMHWIKPVLILSVLWGFSLLAGAAASILRSAVMFSFIAIGESLDRKSNIYNTLAASAFCLLVYNPCFLWDVGFQLSYAAILSILLFMKPIYKWCWFQNKLLNAIWRLNAVTLSAQLLTLPIILFYFHQFPNLFLFTNSIAVPLSGLVLYGELLLLLVSAIPLLNVYTGKLVWLLVSQMNGLIERTAQLPYAVTDNVRITLEQTILLYLVIAFFAWWLLQKKMAGLLAGISCLALYMGLRGLNMVQQSGQHVLVIYQVPRHTAIDLIEGNRYRFLGDSLDVSLRDYHLQPARIRYGVRITDSLPNTLVSTRLLGSARKSVLLVDRAFRLYPQLQRIAVDMIILSGNPRIYLSELAAVFDCRQYVFDSSNPLWKIQYWKKDADSLHLRHHSIPEQGALELAL